VGTAEDSERRELSERLLDAAGGERAGLALRLATLELRAGELDAAVGHFASAREGHEAAGERRRAAEAAAGLGLAAALRGEGERGRTLLEGSLAAAEGDPDLVAHIDLQIAEAATATGDAERARVAWERARAHYEVYWNGAALAAIYGGLATQQAGRGAMAAAARLAARALDEAAAAAEPLAIGRALLASADVAAKAGDDPAVERALREAARVLDEHGLRRDLAEAALRFGVHLGARGLDGSAGWLARAHEQFRALGALRDVERVRDAFRRFGRRVTDRAGDDEAHRLVEELRRERGSAGAADRLTDLAGRLERALDGLVVERDRMRTLLELLRGLATRGDPALLPLELARLAAQLVGADRALVALVDDTGSPELRGAARMPEGETVWRAPVAEVIRPGAGPGLFLGEVAGPTALTGRAIACPLVYRERVFGAVYCDRVPSGGTFAVRDLDLVAVFAAQAALLLELARSGAELRRAARMQDGALDFVPCGVVVLRPDGGVESANAIAVRLLGSPSPATLEPWPELLAVVAGEEDRLTALRLPGGACLVRARRVRTGVGAPAGVVVVLTETRPAAAPPPPPAARLGDVVAHAAAMRRPLRAAEAATLRGTHVLIGGEPGTGKRLLACAIAHAGPSGAALALVDCAALPRDQGPIFGQSGVLGLASGGALVLTEVGELDAEAQDELLETLLRHERGGRIVATTSRPPGDERARRFQRRLRERLGAVYIELPPLRERPDDVAPLVEHFAERAATRLGKAVRGASAEVLDAMRAYTWPGNVRELEELVTREVARVAPDVELLHEVPPPLAARPGAPASVRATAPSIAEVERQLLLAALRQHRGNVPKVARSLGVSRGTVYNKMRKLHIDPGSYRVSS
jgi:transcriptional regulator with AAA-type ATPase domain/PAS domain-containing protein